MKNEPDLSDISLRDLTARHVKAGYSNVYKYVIALEAERDALLTARQETEAQITHLRHWLKSDLSALNRDQLLAAVDRIAHAALALAALPENLRGESGE